MRYLGLGGLALFLAGCALPVPLQLASWAASGVSYATTGKSLSDHAISAMASQDCALHRIALGEEVCFPSLLDDSDIAVASRDITEDSALQAVQEDAPPVIRLRESMIYLAESLDDDLLPASGADNAAEDTSERLDTVLLAMAETLNGMDPAAGSNNAPETRLGSAKHYLVIGRYRRIEDAEQARGRHAALRTAVRMVLREGALLYQVTAGPFNRPDALELEATLSSNEGGHRPVALLCADRATTPPCAGDQIPVQLAARLSGAVESVQQK